jgi:hypothetical protein
MRCSSTDHIDLTAFTEVDPNSRIVVDSIRSEFTELTRSEDAYVYKDYEIESTTMRLLRSTSVKNDKAHLKAIVEDIELDKSKIVKLSCTPIDKKKTQYKLEVIYSPIIK